MGIDCLATSVFCHFELGGRRISYGRLAEPILMSRSLEWSEEEILWSLRSLRMTGE